MYLDKARSLPYCEAPKMSFTGVDSGLTSRILDKAERLVRDKHYSLLQTFVYYGQKRLITFVSGVNIIQLFTAVTYEYSQKQECLSLADFSSLVLFLRVRMEPSLEWSSLSRLQPYYLKVD
jgi:hypothetical protein